MRTLLGLTLVLAACGKPATTPGDHAATPTPPVAHDDKAAPHGTSGLEGLDWGANADAVRAAYPNVTPTDGGLWANGMVLGHTAITKFFLGAAGLDQINTEWTEGFISMADCGKTWKTLRTTLDGRYGASQSDNLAAYWKTATASITLACNPNDSNAGVLTLNYAHLTAD